MSIKIQSECWKLKIHPTQKLVLICLADYADDFGACYPSVDTIASSTGLNSRSVRRTIAELELLGHLTRNFCIGKRTDYTIHPCHIVTTDIESPLSESPIPLSESTQTPDRGVNITIINHQEPPIKEIGSPTAQPREKNTGTRLPADWSLPDDWAEDAIGIGVEHYQAFLESEKFRDYWHSVAGAKGRKADWRATWRNWVRRSQENAKRNMSHAEHKHAFNEHKARRDFGRATPESF